MAAIRPARDWYLALLGAFAFALAAAGRDYRRHRPGGPGAAGPATSRTSWPWAAPTPPCSPRSTSTTARTCRYGTGSPPPPTEPFPRSSPRRSSPAPPPGTGTRARHDLGRAMVPGSRAQRRELRVCQSASLMAADPFLMRLAIVPGLTGDRRLQIAPSVSRNCPAADAGRSRTNISCRSEVDARAGRSLRSAPFSQTDGLAARSSFSPLSRVSRRRSPAPDCSQGATPPSRR